MNNIGVSLEQARALVAVAEAGTFASAAAALRRGHTSVLYLLRTLEDALGFAVLDRSGYRTKLTAAGVRVLEGCRALLAAEAELAGAIGELRTGWEPALGVVFDGIVPIDPLLRAVGRLVAERVPTRIEVRAEFLSGVDEAFSRGGDLMIAVLPPRQGDLATIELPALPAVLVAHADHPLAHGRHDARALSRHILLTVRGSDPRLVLPTSGVEARSTVLLNDFAAKRAAILAGLGYGWLPEAMIRDALAVKQLVPVRWSGASQHLFLPRLYHRGHLGPAARVLVEALTAAAAEPSTAPPRARAARRPRNKRRG